MDFLKNLYEYFFSKKYCFINEHMHIVNVQVDGKSFDIKPMEHHIIKINISAVTNILCEMCQVNTETAIRVSEDVDKHKNQIIYIDQYLRYSDFA